MSATYSLRATSRSASGVVGPLCPAFRSFPLDFDKAIFIACGTFTKLDLDSPQDELSFWRVFAGLATKSCMVSGWDGTIDMMQYSVSPLALISSLWNNRGLIWQMTKRDVVGRYRGSVLGILWSFFNPVLMLAVYTLVFSGVFKARWSTGSESKTEFAIVLFVGLIIHGLFAECVNRAPSLILGNVNYVKKVVFPLEILPWVAVGSALFHAAISSLVLLSFFAAINLSVNWTFIFFPFLLIPLVLVTTGLAWFLASTGVFLRDVGQTTSIITSIMMFLSPVFYPISSLPEAYRHLLYINPLTSMIEQARNVLIWGRLPNWAGLAVYGGIAVMVAWAGFAWFQKTRRGFADVL